MSKYIDAERISNDKFFNGMFDKEKAKVLQWFLQLPTANVVEVVRCKDCIHKQTAKINSKGFLICPASGMEITDDDFCSYGKRR